MELRIVIFLAVVSVTLALNVATLIYLYRVLDRAARRMEANRKQIDSVLGGLRATLEGTASVTSAAADWSRHLKEQMEDLEPQLLETSSRLGYGLAKIDFTVDAYSRKAADGVKNLRKRTAARIAGRMTQVFAMIEAARALGHIVSIVAERTRKSETTDQPTPYRSPDRKIL